MYHGYCKAIKFYILWRSNMTDIERRIEILNNTIERYTNLLAKYGNVSTWKNYVKKAEAELNQLKT